MWSFLTGDKGKSQLVDQAFGEMSAMLNQASTIVSHGTACLLGVDEPEDLEVLDERINSGERLVRRLVVEHLSLNPEQDLPASLMLLSIVHEVERIGDYGKSLIELSQLGSSVALSEEGRATVEDLGNKVADLLELTVVAFGEADADKANAVMEGHRSLKAQTDAILEGAVMADPGPRPDAMIVTVASRYYRRAGAHASNVASAIVNPLDMVTRDSVG